MRELIIFGKKYIVKPSDGNRSDVSLLGDELILIGRDEKARENILNKWLLDYASIEFMKEIRSCYPLFSEYKIDFPNLKVRKMKSRWGSCIPGKCNICLNLELLNLDRKYLHYVVIHELSHLVEANHSKAFWDIVEKFVPDWKEIRKGLACY